MRKRLFDNHGRILNYVRLAVTDRCNLRCFYCMPERGIQYIHKTALMTYEEIHRALVILAEMGIEKIRITGGEPFVRKDLIHLLWAIRRIHGIRKINITTNGTVLEPHILELKKLGIDSINLSLDSLDRDRFFEITRRDVFDKVMRSFELLLEHDFEVKINAVVMAGKNEEDILPMVQLTKDLPVSVRFIEEMPFNGAGAHYEKLQWNYQNIIKKIKAHFPTLTKIPDPPFSTAMNFRIPNHRGNIGIIAAYSRTFCGTCNRIRITPKGMLKTCLYDNGIFNIKTLMREGATDDQLRATFLDAFNHRAKDGFVAERNRFGKAVSESMATIGG
ncbi:MAG: GTP 3',8-cyclase MoaA [Bacteroidota bacterium]